MTDNITFSIITVTRNASAVIGPTLDSIARQTCVDYEFLLIDGASTDDTVEVARSADITRARIISEPDGGLYDAMNKGLSRARGAYLIWLNAGDRFASADVLERLKRYTDGRPGVIYGQTRLVDMRGAVVGERHLSAPERLTADSFKQGMLVCHQAFVARRDLAQPYDLAYRFSADYEWCIRVLMASECNAYVGDRPIIDFLTDGLTTRHHRQSLMERYRIMCRYYGVFGATFRHLGFLLRHLGRKWR